MKRGRIEIKNANSLNDIIQDMLLEFTEDFYGDERFTRKSTLFEQNNLEDCDSETYLLTDRAEKLVDRYIDRMNKVFIKYFDENEFDIQTPFSDLY